MSYIANIGKGFIDFIAPKYCLVCNNPISENEQTSYICDECYHNMPFAPQSEVIMDRMFEIWNADDIAISKICSLFSVKDAKYMQLIHSLKYYSLKNIGIELGKLLGNRLLQENMTEYEAIIPVPIHKAKERERGYNQSNYIVNGIYEVLKIPPNYKMVQRKIYTQTQTALNAEQRKSNVEHIFEINRNTDKQYIINKSFLIVDDVFTTGSTLNSLALMLLDKGARKIDCATLGIA
ncbi:MAG TPA: phosphoribosyltransferase family protein [Candidatus Kapabacteria bacterium]|nr:ComF family protein [Candidatus Kapabacteria bacterium]HOV92923.1 phosphoribosyltransferase family protein [Candidatus Kapabacteria bacterium]